MNRTNQKAFTLIELLVVIAIIAIIAAILFPVFASAREKGRQATCVSNAKQFLLGILQYCQDYDDGMPITFKDANSFGSGTVQYNVSSNSASDPDYLGQQTGIPQEIQPYVKSETLFQCPDDHTISAAEAKSIGNSSTPGGNYNTIVGMTYWQVYGTSYKFTNQNYTHPNTTNAKSDTGYAAIPFCTSAGSTKCDFAAQHEPMAPGSPALGSGATFVPQNAAEYNFTSTQIAQSEVTLSMFARPSETRCVGDWVKTWADNPSTYFFHPTGTMIGYIDGHAKFLLSEGASYQTGCDGLDWAWDYAGSCNTLNLQREAD